MRLGILGVSWWTDMVWPGFSRVEDVEVTWIAARTGAKAEKYAADHGIPNWTDDYDKLIAAPDVDAVFVAVPNFLHTEMARKALAHGKHVLQEKPMALSSADAQSLADEAAANGLVLMPELEYGLANGVRDLHGIIDTRIGPLRKALVGMTLAGGSWGGWRGDPALTGGSFFEMGIHQIFLTRWIFRRNPLAVTAHGVDEPGHDFTLVFDFGEGDSAIVDYCWRSIGFRQRIECYGARGYVTQDIQMPAGSGVQSIVTADGAERTEFDACVQGADTFERVLHGFAHAVHTGTPPPVAAEDGVWAVRMAEAARESVRTGGTVRF